MRTLVCLYLLLILAEARGFAQTNPQNLKKLSLEDLMKIDVTTVARRPEPLDRTPAAITVITAEDIRRSGVTRIPEVLRLVPGLQVAQADASTWAISSRGFNSTISDKLLVMIDGRTVYTPFFGGVFWDIQDLVLEDIERIEVVRGPGATLWGTNAVNGIINIITKSAQDAHDGVAVANGGGVENLAIAAFRAGAAPNKDTSYRLYGKYAYWNQLKFEDGADALDSSRWGRFGYRIDSTKGSDSFMSEGQAYRGLEGLQGLPDAKILGGYLLGRWNRDFSDKSSIRVQTSYERYLRRVEPNFNVHQRIFDIDLQHHFAVRQHTITWGGEYRWNSDSTAPTSALFFDPADRNYPLEAAFVQDEISAYKDRLFVQAGVKVEHNAFTGIEVQPSVRASWAIRPQQFVWAAVTRAVRIPTRLESDVRVPPQAPGALPLSGNPGFQSEILTAAMEFGYRSRVSDRLTVDVATFFNVYDNLRVVGLRDAPPPTLTFLNASHGKTYGGEVSGNFDARTWLRFGAAYSYLGERLTAGPPPFNAAQGIVNSLLKGDDPTNQFFLRTAADLPHNLEFDSALRFVGQLPAPVVPSYWELDTRFGWNVKPNVELSVVGRNLLHHRHLEFIGLIAPVGLAKPEEVPRDVYGRIVVRF
jgi:iron complex outermembrane recepter protein